MGVPRGNRGFGTASPEQIARYIELHKNLDATGDLVVANARLEASINGTDREVNKAKKAFADASAIGDVQGQKDAINAQLAAAENLQI